jgi:hypothetical protein
MNHCAIFANPNPRRLSLTSSGYQISHRKFPWSPCHRRVLPGAFVPSSSHPWSLCAVVESSPCCHSRPRSSPFTRHHLPRPEPVTLSTMQAPSLSPRRHSRTHNNVVLSEPVTMCTPCRSRARNIVDLRHPRAHITIIPEPMTPLSP